MLKEYFCIKEVKEESGLLQVEFLCDRGADVNRGLRSSSLHYAACFGRPQIVKVWPVTGCRAVSSSHLSTS